MEPELSQISDLSVKGRENDFSILMARKQTTFTFYHLPFKFQFEKFVKISYSFPMQTMGCYLHFRIQVRHNLSTGSRSQSVHWLSDASV